MLYCLGVNLHAVVLYEQLLQKAGVGIELAKLARYDFFKYLLGQANRCNEEINKRFKNYKAARLQYVAAPLFVENFYNNRYTLLRFFMSRPCPTGPASASPESLIRTLLYAGFIFAQ